MNETFAERVDRLRAESITAADPERPYRVLAEGYGLWILPMLFNYRIAVGPIGAMEYDDAWCYRNRVLAEAAADAWDPLTEPEPDGWHKHPSTGRRRDG